MLEMRLSGNRYVGSNPTISATDACKHCVCRHFYFGENAGFSFFSFHEKRARQVILEPSPLQTLDFISFPGLNVQNPKHRNIAPKIQSTQDISRFLLLQSPCVY